MTSLLRIAAAAVLAVSVASTSAIAQVAVPAGSVAAVDFTEGQAVARSPSGQERPLAKGDGIARGDSVITGAGRVQLRFLDEGYLSIYANTEFLIEDYFYAGQADGTESAAFRLVHGGIRALTGAIGKANRDNYSVTTNIGTIGIRGTGYTASMGDGMSASVSEGAIALTNRAGELLVRPGQTGFMSSADAPPVLVSQRPYLPPTPPATRRAQDDTNPPGVTRFRPADQRTPDGGLPIIPHEGDDDHGGHGGHTFEGETREGWNVSYGVQTNDVRDSSLVYLDDGVVNSWQWDAGGGMGRGYKDAADQGGDSVIAWSRWTEGRMEYLSGDDGWHEYPESYDTIHAHLVAGAPATEVPVSGSADYAMMGGTRPTLSVGSADAVGTLNSATLRVDFASQRVGLEMSTSQGATDWGVQTLGGLAGTAHHGMRLTSQGDSGLTPHHYFYGNSGGGDGSLVISRNGADCGDCYGAVRGFLAGEGASHAGLTYVLGNSNAAIYGSEGAVVGAVGFQRR